MGRASRRKGEAHAVRRDRPRLLASLAEAREFLSASSNSYDHGFEAEAKRIAVSLRMLLHDTSASHSVLEQLRVKRAIHWVDTADPINPRNLIPSHPGLVIMQSHWTGERAIGTYVAPLGNVPPERLHALKPFTPWWETPVMRDGDRETWSRRDLVLTLANKEGGAHVDPSLDDKYERMVTGNGLGWVTGDREGVYDPFGGNAIGAAVRQIGFEVTTTLDANNSSLQ